MIHELMVYAVNIFREDTPDENRHILSIQEMLRVSSLYRRHKMYNKMEAFFQGHKLLGNIILAVEGAAIGIMFALAL